MAEAILNVLFDNLSSLIQGKIGLILGVDEEMKKLSKTLTAIQKVLEDAEDQQFQSKSIQNWLVQLNDVAYEIEDILDECQTEVSKRKGGKFNLQKYLDKFKIGRRMKEAGKKLESIAEDRHNFQLQEIIVKNSNQVDWRRETGFVLNEPDHIYGRNEDKEMIVDLLVNQVKECKHLSVLPIIGIGGMGKTTLAQLVYNDDNVSEHFDTKLWICVSDDFDLKAILNSIIESATGVSPNLDNLSTLQYRLRQELNGKRYLLVLDDLWNENQDDWFKLRSVLACGSIGASIVVTTRMKKVADIMGTLSAHCLAELSEEHCWLLFRLRAFGQENVEHPKLEAIGRRIVKKCGGVPLVAKALGGLLRFKREEKEWILVEESHIWNLPEEEKSIMSILRLSYHHLPFVLKRCFFYCSIFPKDYAFKKDELIFHWMAHGCISSNELQEVEDVGDQIWKELALRSFFQEIHTEGRDVCFKMHDLVHDLAQSIMENKVPGAKAKDIGSSSSDIKIREVHWRKKFITTSSSISIAVSTLTNIMKYNRLRTLKLNSPRVEELPSAIGKLKHLRCLDLSYSSIRTLPRTFCCLCNLQILNLNWCNNLKSLPKNIRYMTSLRHIFLEGCWRLSHMPYRIGKLVSLKTLSVFIVDDRTGNQLDELERLNLGGRLEIKHLENVQNHMNANRANLFEKSNLRHLVLKWDGEERSSDLTKMMDDEKVLEALEPHLNLTTLRISGFKGHGLALWMRNMKNITNIFLYACRNVTHLPPLGDLPLLEILELCYLDALEYITEENDIQGQNSLRAKFPSLKTLELDSLPNLKGLLKEEGVGEMFPNLQTLDIEKCPLLKVTSTFVSSALKSVKEVRCSPLILPSFSWKIEHLSHLALDFGEIDDTTICNDVPEDALQGLCKLDIRGVDNAWQNRLLEKWSRGLNSLTRLEILECKIGNGFPEGLLRHLTSLEDLAITCCEGDLVDMAEEIKHLQFLKRLDLHFVYDMVSLPDGLQHIPLLQSLALYGLDGLTSLPDWLPNLVGLARLEIIECPAIPSLPSCIPQMTNLRSLDILRCPQLQIRCVEPNGEDWHKIAHIPRLNIEYPF